MSVQRVREKALRAAASLSATIVARAARSSEDEGVARYQRKMNEPWSLPHGVNEREMRETRASYPSLPRSSRVRRQAATAGHVDGLGAKLTSVVVIVASTTPVIVLLAG